MKTFNVSYLKDGKVITRSAQYPNIESAACTIYNLWDFDEILSISLDQEIVEDDLPAEPTQEELSAAFDRVKDPRHWKFPTRRITVDTQQEADLIVRAVIHFTGGVPSIRELKSGKISVSSSPGYYNIIGA